MLIAFKALGATCLAGALAASGVLTTDHFAGQDQNGPATAALAADPHASFKALAVGAETDVPAGAAGSVTVRRTAAGLEIGAVAPAVGWTSLTKTLAADWILVTFEAPGQKIDLSLDIAGDNLRIRTAAFDVALPTTTTTTALPTTSTTEPPTPTTTTPPTTAPPPQVVTLPPPVQPTVIPVAGAGTVVIVVQGPVVVIRDVKVVPGWVASVERRSGDVDVLFRNGDRSFRFFASMADQRLTSAIREVRADGDHAVTPDDHRDSRDSRDGQNTDRHGDGRDDGGHRGRH
jgi:hypothetical protein